MCILSTVLLLNFVKEKLNNNELTLYTVPHNDSHSNANHAGDGGEPHVGDLVDGEVVEAVVTGLVGGRRDRLDPLGRAPLDRRVLGNSGDVGVKVLGHRLPEADPHREYEAHEGAHEGSLGIVVALNCTNNERLIIK